MAEAFSDPVNVTTDAEAAPDQPTCTAGTPTETGVTLTSSAFSDANSGDGDTHAASQWQVTTAADTSYASPVISTGDDATNLTSYAASGLTGSTDYIARVRHKDSTGLYSDWSADESFTTAAAPAPNLAVTRSGAITDGGTDALGTVAQGSTQSLPYTITNDGDAPATLGTIAVGTGLAITADPSGQTIAAAGTKTLTVSVDTSAVDSISAAVSIPSDDSDSPYNWTVTADVTDQTAPTVTSARFTSAAADEIRVNLSETCTGTLGFSVDDGGAAITVTPTNHGTYILLALSRAADPDATTLDYDDVSGDIADAAPNALAAFSGVAVSAFVESRGVPGRIGIGLGISI